jgi:GNAT superfamily N-acetyltransferase
LFYWGNFLLFREPPQTGDFERWKSLFAQEIGTPPQYNHITFGWDSPNGEVGQVQPFLDAGFSLNHDVVLTAQSLNLPPRLNTQVEIRPLHADWEWQAAIDTQVDCRPGAHTESGYREFKVRQFDRYRRMAEAGLGHWFGAFVGDRMVADLGIYCDREVARFQAVETIPEYQRQGICGTLVYTAGSFAFEQMGVRTLVMVADEFYHAARIYESVGFRPTEREAGLEWWR